MTIIVFLVDTSASMNQRIFLGGRPSLLDVAKSAVEYFVKVRQRSAESRGDRYMLLTFDDPPGNIRAGWKENLSTFMSELKNLESRGLTTLGSALRHTLDVLNVNRMQHGIDTYGQGRCPFYLEPSLIILLTDGGLLSSNSGVVNEIKMQGTSPGAELTREPFRWDQRLFGLVLRMSGQPSALNSSTETGLVPTDDGPVEAMCEATGGRSYAIKTHRMLHQCIESIAQKVQAGVVLHIEKWGPDPILHEGEEVDTKWHSTRRLVQVPRGGQKGGYGGGFWPLPESFWPDPGSPSLPPRTAHPHVRFTCATSQPLLLDNFPFDKYDLEPNPLTKFILARKMAGVCWQVFVPNSGKTGGLGGSFGYLKASSNLSVVSLFVMPYNYGVLLPLLQDLLHIHRLKPSGEWRAQFYAYTASIPPYYIPPLKRALIRIGASAIAQSLPEENYLSVSVLNYLKQLKYQSKMEYERTCSEVGSRVIAKEAAAAVTVTGNQFKNPFDIPRKELLETLAKLKTQFFHPNSFTDTQQALHNQPIQQMGNYVEYLKRQSSPLREIESTTPLRQHMFGNPFKIDKRIVIDQIDEASDLEPTTLSPDSPEAVPHMNRSKRKPGPLPHNYHFKPMRERTGGESPWSDAGGEEEPLIGPPPALVTPLSDFDLDTELDNNEVEDPFVESQQPEPIDLDPPSPPPPDPVVEEVEPEEENETDSPPPEPQVDEKTIWRTNLTLRDHIFKEIRRPLVRMDLLQTHLRSLVGSGETKRKMVKLLEREALRFKRRKLAKVFEERAEELLSEEI